MTAAIRGRFFLVGMSCSAVSRALENLCVGALPKQSPIP